jgi:hypothetical protein
MWEYKGNVASKDASDEVKGLWNVYENDLGESTLQEHIPKVVWESCLPDKHYFEITNSPKREATCKYCKTIVHYIVGIDVLKDGKFSKK